MLKLIIVALLLLNALMLYRMVWTESGILHLGQVREAYQELEKRNQALLEENKELSRTIMALRNDEKYIERAVRTEMRYVKDEEVIYYFAEDHDP